MASINSTTPDAVAYARLALSVHGRPERLAMPPFPTSPAPPLRGEAGAVVVQNVGEQDGAHDGARGGARSGAQ